MEGEALMLGWKRKQAGIYVSVCEMYAITSFDFKASRGNGWMPYYTGGKEARPLAKHNFLKFSDAEYICALHELMNHPQRSS